MYSIGVTERPYGRSPRQAVSQDTDVPGETLSATQPIPSKPAPFDRQGVSKARSD